MLARVKRTIFGNTSTVEGTLIDVEGVKCIIPKDVPITEWISRVIFYDEGTEEYFIHNMWFTQEEITHIFENAN